MFRRLGNTEKKWSVSLFKLFRRRPATKQEEVTPVQPNTDLVVRNEPPHQDFPTVLHLLLKKAIADADDLSATIKAKALTEADAEAKRIIAQANIEAQGIKGKAQIDAQRNADEILSAANRKAQIIEAEARQNVMQLLAMVGEEAEKEINGEYERAYSRLSASLQDLIRGGQEIETGLKNKREKLMESKRLEIGDYGSKLLSSPEVTSAETPASETKLKPEVVNKETAEELIKISEEPLEKLSEESGQLEAKLPEEKVEQPTKLEEVSQEAIRNMTEEVVLKPSLTDERPGTEITQEAAKKADEVTKPQPVKESKKTGLEFTPLTLDNQTLYTGEVELFIAPSVELKLVSKLYNYLQTVPEMKILFTRGSWNQGTTVTIAAEKPLPLIRILSEAPEVEVVPELMEEEDTTKSKAGSLPRSGERRLKRIRLDLKEADYKR